jgi:hypothetical protein
MATTVSIRDDWDSYASSNKAKNGKNSLSSLFSVFKPAGDGASEPLIDENSLDEVPGGEGASSESWLPALVSGLRHVTILLAYKARTTD